MEEVTATIHRDLVDEFFGDGPFKCECHAWSSRGVVKSQAATVHIACEYTVQKVVVYKFIMSETLS